MYIRYEDIFPIPLTDEWVEKFGFSDVEYKKCYTGVYVKHKGYITTDFVLSYPKRMGEWQDFFTWEFSGYHFVELKYVHELQNLFFALEKQELQVKL